MERKVAEMLEAMGFGIDEVARRETLLRQAIALQGRLAREVGDRESEERAHAALWHLPAKEHQLLYADYLDARCVKCLAARIREFYA